MSGWLPDAGAIRQADRVTDGGGDVSRATCVVAALALLAAGGCGSGDVAAVPVGDAELDGVTWRLTSVTLDGDRARTWPWSDLTLTVDGGRASGGVACNDWSTAWDADGTNLDVGDELTVTLAGCVGPADPAGLLFLPALQRVDHGVRQGRTLVLTGSDVELRFTG